MDMTHITMINAGFILGASGLRPDRALRLYLLPDSPKRAKGYRFNPLRLAVGYISSKTRNSA
jgi:hypothetical protein